MTDIAQTALLGVIVTLSILLLILGVQVFFILKDLRKTLVKANKMLDDVNVIAENVAHSASAFSALATVVKTGAYLANLIAGNKKTEQNNEMQVKNDFAQNGNFKKQRRFFRGIIKKVKPEAFL